VQKIHPDKTSEISASDKAAQAAQRVTFNNLSGFDRRTAFRGSNYCEITI
jgi:hypothetical protein